MRWQKGSQSKAKASPASSTRDMNFLFLLLLFDSAKAIYLFTVAVLAVPVFVSGAPPQEDIVK